MRSLVLTVFFTLILVIMCHRVTCPNDGKPTWWGCGQHIEDKNVLGDIPEEERCHCEHVPVVNLPGLRMIKQVKKNKDAAPPAGKLDNESARTEL